MKQLLSILFTILFIITGCSPEQAVDITPHGDDVTSGSSSDLILDVASEEEDESAPAEGSVEEAIALLEAQGYYVGKSVDILNRPAGFPEEDEFPLEEHDFSEKDGGSVQEACRVITTRELKKIGRLDDWYKPVYAYCRHRVMNSSRTWQLGKPIVSRVDGSQIHDRDRSSAHYFYKIAVKSGRMNPEVCPHHRIPSLHIEHPPENLELAENYEQRFKTPLDPDRKLRWLSASHAYEQFGARGPVDWNAYHGYKAIGGCFPFSSFDRVDVALSAVIRRSMKICAKYGCDNVNTIKYIKPHWNEGI